MSGAADRLYGLLTKNQSLRRWVTDDYFSPFTLHQWLLSDWFPEIGKAEREKDKGNGDSIDEAALAVIIAERDRVSAILDIVRDSPLQPGDSDTTEDGRAAVGLIRLTLELLHAYTGDVALRARLQDALLALLPPRVRDRIGDQMAVHVQRLEFTLVLAALHSRLDFVTGLWPVVEAELNLDVTSNVLSRRPPQDYEPFILESPMGNVLGFQFRPDEGGRERVAELLPVQRRRPGAAPRPAHDAGRGRPAGPGVLLMSATSWAGTSSRYHVHVPVGAILRPQDGGGEGDPGHQLPHGVPLRPRRAGAAPVRDRPSGARRAPADAPPAGRARAELAGATSKLADELADLAATDPDRCRILILTGSYAEAQRRGRLPERPARVGRAGHRAHLRRRRLRRRLGHPPRRRGQARAGRLRRGDVASFAATGSEILVAPLLAVERGHNIVIPGGKAAIGTVYFLARPHPRPDDIDLAIQAVNDWAVRYVRDGGFRQLVRASGGLDAAGLAFRKRGERRWRRFLTRRMSWSSLPPDEKVSVTWDQLVVMWQVIGRLVRGGVPARVVFVDAAFAPSEAGMTGADTAETSLLVSMREVLAPYFTGDSGTGPVDRSLVDYLYQPLYQALAGLG